MSSRESEHALLARFADRRAAESAMAMVEASGPPARRVDLIPPPTRTRRFDRRRLLWGLWGATAGAVGGGALAALFSFAMEIDRGMIVGGPAGVILTGVVIGALMVGTLGLLAGLGLSEARAPREVADRELKEDVIPGEALVRVWVRPGADDRALKELLARAGALSVGEESHSAWPDERVLVSRPVQEQPA